MYSDIINVIISGLIHASVYALLTMGLALIYGVGKVFNLAYGSLYSLAGYIAWVLLGLGMGYPLVIIITMTCMFLIGMLIDITLIRPVRSKRKDWNVAVVIITLGLSLVLDNMDVAIFGPFPKSMPPLFAGNINLGSFVFSNNDLAVLIISIIVIVALILYLNKTRQGMAIRAVSQDMLGAEIVGIRQNTIFTYTFAISSVLVGIGAVLLASKLMVSQAQGWDILFKAWVITAFGGMGSLSGAAIAAVILAMIEAFVFWKFGGNITQIGWFVVLVGTFIFRPQGISGTKL